MCNLVLYLVSTVSYVLYFTSVQLQVVLNFMSNIVYYLTIMHCIITMMKLGAKLEKVKASSNCCLVRKVIKHTALV